MQAMYKADVAPVRRFRFAGVQQPSPAEVAPVRRFRWGGGTSPFQHPWPRPPNVGEEGIWLPPPVPGDPRSDLSMIYAWIGIEYFPPATKTKFLELLQTLQEKARDSLTILVMGKCRVGKSSTVNSIFGERVIPIPALNKSDEPRPVMAYRERPGFTLNIIDTPSIVKGGHVNYQALQLIKRFSANRTIDVLLYVDRLDAVGEDNLDRQIVKAITKSFGKEIWRKGVVALTHAQLTPPDGLTYDDFYARRSEAVLKVVHSGARFKKYEIQDHAIPVVLVENGTGCNKNDNGEQILPNGTVWIPNIVKTIKNVATNENKSILVDQKPIHAPDANILACFSFLKGLFRDVAHGQVGRPVKTG